LTKHNIKINNNVWLVLRLTGLYALRRLSAARVPQNTSRANALCGVLLHHSFAVAGTLRVPLSQPQNRRIQPERYMKFWLELVGKYIK